MASIEYMNAVNLANVNATGFVNLAKKALSDAQAAATKVGFGDVVWAPITPPNPPGPFTPPVPPTIPPPTMTLPGAPGAAPGTQLVPGLTLAGVPTKTTSAPVLDFGNMPSSIGAAPTEPLINTNFVFPSAPGALTSALPAPPAFNIHTEPDSPEILLPQFSAAVPLNPDAAPTNGQQLMDESYATQSLVMQTNLDGYTRAYIAEHAPGHQAMMTRLNDVLTRGIENGTGIPEAAELAMIDRARARNDVEAKKVQDAAFADAAARGFTIPSGALYSALARARQEAANNQNKTINETLVWRAEMEQKHAQFCITTSKALVDSARQAVAAHVQNAVAAQGHAVDYAKSVFANLVEMYNASLRYYNTQIEVFKVNASVFETQLRSEMAKLELYRGELSAFEALNQADKTKADVYRASLEAVNTLASVYKTQVEATVSEASLEKLKLDMFQARVQSFGAQVQAKNSEWGGYTARISGEESKVRIYSAQMAAYGSEIEAYKSTIAAKTAEIGSVASSNQAVLGGYSTEVQAYVAQVNAEVSRTSAENENNRLVITEYQRQIAGFMASVNLKLEEYKANNEAKVKNATGDLSAQVELARAKSQFGTTLAQLSNDGAHVYGTLAASALSGVNTLAAMTETL